MYGLKNQTTSIVMFTPHVLFPIKYQGQIKKVSERIFLAKEVYGNVLIDRLLTNSDRLDSVHCAKQKATIGDHPNLCILFRKIK
jgi:hypothetical protein